MQKLLSRTGAGKQFFCLIVQAYAFPLRPGGFFAFLCGRGCGSIRAHLEPNSVAMGVLSGGSGAPHTLFRMAAQAYGHLPKFCKAWP